MVSYTYYTGLSMVMAFMVFIKFTTGSGCAMRADAQVSGFALISGLKLKLPLPLRPDVFRLLRHE